MPFTLAHPVAVLPLRRLGSRLALPPLVAGSMAPDVPYFTPVPLSIRTWTHSLVGALTVDVVLAAALLGFGAFVAGPTARLLPYRWGVLASSWTRTAWPRRWLAAPSWYAALAVGAVTHVGWDAFTHPDGWVVVRWAPLRADVAGHSVEHWLQYGCSVAGVAFVGFVLWRAAGRVPDRPDLPASQVPPSIVVALAVGAAGVGAGLKALGDHRDGTLRFDLATGAGAGLAVALVAYAAATHVVHRRRNFR